MENNLENKSRFFAQYWGQKVLGNSNTGWKNWNIHDVSLRSVVLAKSDFLELTPLSDITDEDAIEVARHLARYKSDIVNSVKEHLKENHPYGDYLEQPELDYLRSKGYALPWMGLSVEKIIEFGWMKLNPSNK